LSTVVFALPGNERIAAGIATRLGVEQGGMTVRRFPDGESYVRIDTPVSGQQVAFICTLHEPDQKVPALLFAASTARELGASRIGLIAPYLAYMRQDKRFTDGESITSIHFAKLISGHFDWLITVDPHLHRWTSLGQLYSVPSLVVHAAPMLSHWIRGNVEAPILIGPDSESEQWVSAVARGAEAPYLVLEKIRRGDRDVSVSIPDIGLLRGGTPVLVDDIISTARTMMTASRHLAGHGIAPPVCVGVHTVFAGDAHAELLAAGAGRIVTANTIPHPSNAIDVTPAIADALSGPRAPFSTGNG
jgi:ribose-phosphate pyrophosphokinase